MFCMEEKNVFIYAFYIDKSRAVKCILPSSHKYKYVGVRPQTAPFYLNFASQRVGFRVKWGYIAREGRFSEGKFHV